MQCNAIMIRNVGRRRRSGATLRIIAIDTVHALKLSLLLNYHRGNK